MKVKACKHAHHSGSSNKRLTVALNKVRELHLRLTGPRKEILSVLANCVSPMSSEEVFGQLKKGKSDLVTVYRSLSTLEEAGLLHLYDLGDGTRRYELSQEGHHHHYVHCRSCGGIEAFEGCDFEENVLSALAKKGYRMVQHSLNVHALCSACQ